jgi:hypothetical protein
MLPAVNFDNESALPANKVDNESPDRLLTDKLATAHCSGAQTIPKQKFGIGRILTKLARGVSPLNFRTAHVEGPPHPTSLRSVDLSQWER